jgi:hypothetical protein
MRFQRQAAGALALALATIGAALIAGPGNTAHPLRNAWVLVGLVCAALGVLILTLLVVERPSVTAQHDRALRDLLTSARGAVQSEQVSQLASPPPGPPGPAVVFAAHFRDLTTGLGSWNKTLTDASRARDGLRLRCEREVEARQLDAQVYREKVIARAIDALTVQRAARGTLGDPLALEFAAERSVWTAYVVERHPAEGLHLAGDRDWAIDMTGIPAGDEYKTRATELAAPVNDLLLGAQAWPETREVQAAYEALAAFERDRLLRTIDDVLARRRFSYRRRCPVCRPR